MRGAGHHPLAAWMTPFAYVAEGQRAVESTQRMSRELFSLLRSQFVVVPGCDQVVVDVDAVVRPGCR